MLWRGITAVGEFHYYVPPRPRRPPYGDPNAMGEGPHRRRLRRPVIRIKSPSSTTAYPSSGFDSPHRHHSASPTERGRWALEPVRFSRNGITQGAVPPSTPYGPCPQGSVRPWAAGPRIGGPRSTPPLFPMQRRRTTPCRTAARPHPDPTPLRHGLLGPRTTGSTTPTSTDEDNPLLGSTGTAPGMCPTTNSIWPTHRPRVALQRGRLTPLPLRFRQSTPSSTARRGPSDGSLKRAPAHPHQGHWTAAALLRAASCRRPRRAFGLGRSRHPREARRADFHDFVTRLGHEQRGRWPTRRRTAVVARRQRTYGNTTAWAGRHVVRRRSAARARTRRTAGAAAAVEALRA